MTGLTPPLDDIVNSGVTSKLARFVADSQLEDLPASVLHEAKRTLLNHLAAGFGGCREPAIETLMAVFGPLSGSPQAHLIGRPERLDGLAAAFMNAAASNVLDFCDTHLRTVIHPGAPVCPPLLALAEQRSAAGKPVRGAELLHALVLGVEIACRVGNAMSPAHYAQGWHITSTCGGLGAAAAAGKLLRLDAQQMAWALGNAAAQACGLVEMLGFDAKSLSVGNAARGGLLAALLAERGFAGPARPLEGQRGLLAVMSPQPPQISALVDGLGATFEIQQNTYKPYPCGVVLHPVIDACLELRERPGISPAAIERILVRGHPLLRQRADRPRVATGREAQVCLRHTIGVAFIDGAAGVEQYTDTRVSDPLVRALGDRVRIEDDVAIPVEGVQIVVTLASGAKEVARVAAARGSLGRPLADSEIEAKLRALVERNARSIDCAALADAVWRLDQSPDAQVIAALAAV